jgi:hypothetical protein
VSVAKANNMGDRLKVFLSSSQFNDEFKNERLELKKIFSTDKFNFHYDLWLIENQASPFGPKEQYSYHVEDSDFLILLLGKYYRAPVAEEFQIAISNNIPVFTFIRQESDAEPEMDILINQVRGSGKWSCDFNDIADLCEKVEESLKQYLTQAVKFLRKNRNNFIAEIPRELEFDEKSLWRTIMKIMKANINPIMSTDEIFNKLKNEYNSYDKNYDLNDTYELLNNFTNANNLKKVDIDGSTVETTFWRVIR